ncbi:putative Calcium/calmodulin-dependent 3',5'-cyclic [Cardiosporidium cionae]|uniref:Phosphodiesterase n=1 Tax=Cardiosporidium cionae TaxID=476202 RepID=A0ABQ7J7H1_9APIC|nr:putative Calcium/calmodulin-dependent 3',5'-cyclic [Cardiosporidium cionae]|eukprot:KAF8819884.1 putative Calcium/calmodulin-dependent 3',5'-cyclic [Cardiosporidium cionae]
MFFKLLNIINSYVKAFADDFRVKRKTSLPFSHSNTSSISRLSFQSNHRVAFAEEVAFISPDTNDPLLPEMMETWYEAAPKIGTEWGLNILQLCESSPNPILGVGYTLLRHELALCGCEDSILINFLQRIESLYVCNPYHNSMHGAMVAHQTACLLRFLDIKQELDSLGLSSIYVATLCHDLGHPGRTNAFFINSYQPMALLYNDISILENYHACLTFTTLRMSNCNIFKSIDTNEFDVIRRNIIEMILCTDMKQHFDTISRFRIRRASPEFDFHNKADDQWLVIKMCIKCADIGHGSIEWATHYQWSCRIIEEFYLQGDEETRLKVAISPLCNRDCHGDMAKSQKGYLEYVVLPLVKELCLIELEAAFLGNQILKSIDENVSLWEKLHQENKIIKFSDEILKYEDTLKYPSRKYATFQFASTLSAIAEIDEKAHHELNPYPTNGDQNPVSEGDPIALPLKPLGKVTAPERRKFNNWASFRDGKFKS